MSAERKLQPLLKRTWSDERNTGAGLRVMLLPDVRRIQITSVPGGTHPDTYTSPMLESGEIREVAAYLIQCADELDFTGGLP